MFYFFNRMLTKIEKRTNYMVSRDYMISAQWGDTTNNTLKNKLIKT